MPIVRIDLIEGKSEDYRTQAGEIVYQTLLDVLNVPKSDRFQVISEHRKNDLPFDRDYLGVHRTDDNEHILLAKLQSPMEPVRKFLIETLLQLYRSSCIERDLKKDKSTSSRCQERIGHTETGRLNTFRAKRWRWK
ncbi:MAG: tautomerase family protein [Candidatus Acidiferrales bacterium]